MVIRTVRKVSTARNGVGAFILPCKKMDFHYCDSGGSSRGMNAFLNHLLAPFAKAHPSIAISVSPRPNKHPVIIGHYINGREKSVCVKNMLPNQIQEKVDLLRNASGEKVKKTNKVVTSTNESVRGIWSPFHGEGRTAAKF